MIPESILRIIYNLRGKYIKQTLLRLEELHKLDPETRKIILDGYNDLFREFDKIIGVADDRADTGTA
jgi:hypothetical protein